MGREDPQLKLRLTEEMKDAVTAAARSNGRSVNAEIVARLTMSFSGDFVPSEEFHASVSQSKEMMEYVVKLSDALTKSKEREDVLIRNLDSMTDKIAKVTETATEAMERISKALDKVQASNADVRQKA